MVQAPLIMHLRMVRMRLIAAYLVGVFGAEASVAPRVPTPRADPVNHLSAAPLATFHPAAVVHEAVAAHLRAEEGAVGGAAEVQETRWKGPYLPAWSAIGDIHQCDGFEYASGFGDDGASMRQRAVQMNPHLLAVDGRRLHHAVPDLAADHTNLGAWERKHVSASQIVVNQSHKINTRN